MKYAWLAVLALSLVPVSNTSAVESAEVWRPLHAFIGTWKGARAGGDERVTRVWASATTNHHLEITEKGAGKPTVWGVVSYDAARQALVLRQFASDGSASDAAYDPAASTADRVVFATPEVAAGRTRITYERAGWNAFVERIERSDAGGTFALVAETRFERKN